MPALNVTNAPANSLTIIDTGVYEINFLFVASASLGALVTFAVRENGVNIPGTVEARILSLGIETVYVGSTITTLAAGDVIDMAISALLALSVTLGTGVTVSLSVKKLDN